VKVGHIVHNKKLLTRLLSGVVVAAVTAGSVLLANEAAGADVPPGTLGNVTINPATGTDTSAIDGLTSGPCPAATQAVDQTIVGPVQADGTAPDATATFPDSNPFPVTGTTGSKLAFSTKRAFDLPFSDTLLNDATARGKTIQAGEYHVVIECTDSFGPSGQVFGTFTGGLIFSDPNNYTVIPNGTPTPTSVPPTPTPTSVPPTPTPTSVPPTPTPTLTPTPPPASIGTITNLSVPVQVKVDGMGILVVADARVIADRRVNPVGAIQFKDGNNSIGNPIRVNGGHALLIAFRPPGSHVTAVFIPAAGTPFTSSMSNTVTIRS
jgi:hypothetical protein